MHARTRTNARDTQAHKCAGGTPAIAPVAPGVRAAVAGHGDGVVVAARHARDLQGGKRFDSGGRGLGLKHHGNGGCVQGGCVGGVGAV